jgi:hypothetical protein
MPTIVKSFTSTNGTIVNPNGFRSAVPPRAKLTTVPLDDNIQIIFPFGPQNIKHDKLAGNTVEIARPGKKPILFLENPNLRSVSFQAVLADKSSGGARPITELLEQLETVAANAYPCNFTYGLTSLAYNVVVTQFSYDVSYRNNAGEPLRAEVSLQLTETPVFTQEIVELKAVTKAAEPPKRTYTKGPAQNTSKTEEDDNKSRATPNSQDIPPNNITNTARAAEIERRVTLQQRIDRTGALLRAQLGIVF